MQRRIRRVLNCVRERTCVSYAKMATIGGMCDVDLIITKATSHDDFPLPERYIQQLLKTFSLSPSSHSAFALALARRFRSTRSWRVALKCLLLLHRLLRSSPAPAPLRAELLWARANRLLTLYPCSFRDCTSSASPDYTAFISAYARLLDESLDCVVADTTTHQLCYEDANSDDDENTTSTPAGGAEDLGRTIELLPQLQSLIDRAVDCWPTGAASRSFLVQSAMKHVIRDSITRYAAFRRDIEVVLENLIQLPYRSCVAAFGVYRKAAAQADHLALFHEWCKNMGYCGSYEYPLIDRIPEVQIRALETFLDGMWQLTDQSSDTNDQSPVSSEVIDDEREVEEEELPLLIEWNDDEESSRGWEDLLEASISGNANYNTCMGSMEVYNPYGFQTPNPFYQQPNSYRIHNLNYGSCPNTPLQHPWIGVYDATCV